MMRLESSPPRSKQPRRGPTRPKGARSTGWPPSQQLAHLARRITLRRSVTSRVARTATGSTVTRTGGAAAWIAGMRSPTGKTRMRMMGRRTGRRRGNERDDEERAVAWREPLPAFGHPPLRGEGLGDQRGHLAHCCLCLWLPSLLGEGPGERAVARRLPRPAQFFRPFLRRLGLGGAPQPRRTRFVVPVSASLGLIARSRRPAPPRSA